MAEKKIRIVTHNAGFHADDVFAVATLALLLGDDNIEVVRTRDQSLIDAGDYVLDVGFVYDEAKNRFDHHQEVGAGMRDNGIPYASFGLVWKKFGVQVCGSQEVADRIDTRLVQQVDAYDNGTKLFSLNERNTPPFLVQDVMSLFEPMWRESRSNDEGFLEAVELAKKILTRLIVSAKGEIEIKTIVDDAYEKAPNKQLIVFDESLVVDRILVALFLGAHPDTLYFIRKHEGGRWQLVCVVDPPMYDDNRKPLPDAWRGKQEAELAAVTGVPDAYFCHREGFMAVADSKEGALKLAEIALAA
ncbi:MAG: UPF0160 protein [Candidatus Campbellbacteria bacterium]